MMKPPRLLPRLIFVLPFVLSLPPLAGEEIDNASARAFNAAAALQNAGLHQRAAGKWQEFIKQYPNNEKIGRAHYFLGVCQLREEKFNEAAQQFQTVLSRWPDLPQADKAQYNLAMARYELAGEANADALRQVAAEFEKVAAKYPGSELVAEAIYYQGDCCFAAGDLQKAVDLFRKLIKDHPDRTPALRAHYDLGTALQELGQPKPAAQVFQNFLAKPNHAGHPLAPEIQLRLGVCLHDTDALDGAAAAFDKVSKQEQYPLADYAALRLGQTRLKQARYEQAATELKVFTNKFRESDYRVEAIKTAGECYFLAGNPQQAINLLRTVVGENDPVAAEAAYWLARSQLQLNQAPAALATAEKAIGRFGNAPFASYLEFTRIDALFAITDRRAETPKLYESFWRKHPDHPLAAQAAYMAAFSAFNGQQYAKAIEIAQQYLAGKDSVHDQQTGDLRFIAAESLLINSPDDAQARASAESLFRTLVDTQPEHPRAAQSRLRIGWCLFASEKYQDAIKYLHSCLDKLDKQEQQPEAHMLIARSHARQNQHAETIAACSAAIAANGKWKQIDEVLIQSAESYRALKQLDQATGQLERLVRERPDSDLKPRALFALGEIARERDSDDQSIQWFRQIADSFPETQYGGPALHALAGIHLGKGQHVEARQWASRLVDGKYSKELKQHGRYIRGIAYSRENNWDGATKDLSEYLREPVGEKEAASARYELSLCRIQQKQFDQARNDLEQLVKSTPDFAHADKAFYELGHALQAENDQQEQAKTAFAWITEHRPESPLVAEAHFRVGQYHFGLSNKKQGDERNAALDAAVKSLNQTLAKSPDDQLYQSAAYLLGDVQFGRERFAEAAQTLAALIKRFPDGTYAGPATFLAAQAFYQLQQYEQALPLYAKVSQAVFAGTPPEQIDAYRSQSLYRAGDCAAQLMRWPESQQNFQALIDKHPKFAQLAEARYGVGYALQRQNQLDQAIGVYEQTTKETETETAAKARFMIGEIQFGRKRYEDAIEQFLMVTVGYPYQDWQALARFETARCFVELGDKQRAVKTLEELIENHADHPRLSDAKKMLADLSR